MIIFTPGKKLGLQQVLVKAFGNFFLNENGPKNLRSGQSTPLLKNFEVLIPWFQLCESSRVHKSGNFIC